MSSSQPHPSPELGEDTWDTQEGAPTAKIQLLYPEKKAEEAGVVRQFEWTGEGAKVTGDIARGDAGLAITRVEVSAPLSAGITRQLLRSMPLGDVLKFARAELTEQELGTSRLGEKTVKLPPGRVPMTDELLRKVSLAYLEETRPGKDRQATRRLAERFGRPEGTVRTWVAKARKEGWLGPGASGRMGAEPGPKLRAWHDVPANIITTLAPGEPKLVKASFLGGLMVDARVMDAVAARNNEAEQAVSGLLSDRAAHFLEFGAVIAWGHSVTTERNRRLSANPSMSLDEVHRQLAEDVEEAIDKLGTYIDEHPFG